MPDEINNRKLLRSFLLVAVAISLVISIIAMLVELEYIDESISNQAAREGQSLYRAVSLSLGRGDVDADKVMLEYVKQQYTVGLNYFILAELYSMTGEEVGKAELSDEYTQLGEISSHGNSFLQGSEKWYRKFWQGGALYFQTITPVYDGNNRPAGYFEGVYRISHRNLIAIFVRLGISFSGTVITVVLAIMLLFPVITRQQRQLRQKNKMLQVANMQILNVLGNAIAKRDNDTSEHNYRVTLYAIFLARLTSVSTAEMRGVIKGALLHDVGKIAIPDQILLKPGRLSESEFEIMKTHVTHGKDIVKGTPWLEDAAAIVFAHHEKYDGSGYPSGSRGENIPLSARIFAIVDVFDALTSRRPYKEPFSVEKTLEIMSASRGTHFDPALYDKFSVHARAWYNDIAEHSVTVLEQRMKEAFTHYFSQ